MIKVMGRSSRDGSKSMDELLKTKGRKRSTAERDYSAEILSESPPNPIVGGNGKGAGVGQFFRKVLLAMLAGCVLVVCRWLAYQLRFDFQVPKEYQAQLDSYWHWIIPLQLGWLLLFRQFSGIYKYFSLPEIRSLAYAMTFSGVSLYGLRWLPLDFSPPRGVILVESMLGFLALGALRAAWRQAYETYFSRWNHRSLPERRVAIIGAGDAGASLARELKARSNLGRVPVAFFDDDRGKWGSRIHGLPVVGAPDQLLHRKEKLGLAEAVIAMPSATPKRLGEIVSLLQEARLQYVTVPSIDQLASGRVRISQLRPVNIEDLLGREPIDLRLNEIVEVLRNRVVMVTGAGGSIGSELCRQVAVFHPRRLLLLEQSEVQLFQIEQELIRLGQGGIIVPVIADILDGSRVGNVLRQHHPAVIFHAAAHKHVTMMESQPSEAIKNNALGTIALAELAAEHGVERFVMISTDKAVNPTSVMGASKRLAEVFLQAFAHEQAGRTRFVTVRFGNVLGSSGSVVPIFERQIAEGGPVTVTHPEVVRFFMTIPEAVGLVLQSCAQGKGGEIFVLEMGKSVKIADLARQMIRLSGLQPGRDIEIKFTGLKPGEKLFEELRHLQANCTETAHPLIKRLTNEPASLDLVRIQMAWLRHGLDTALPDDLKVKLRAVLPEYRPALSSANKAAGAPPKTKSYEKTRHCPRVGAPAGRVIANGFCPLCSNFRLCAWQFGWNGYGETAGRAAAEPAQQLEGRTAGR